jgi:murein DD-endopeptidase MepM/ murein hydrolase activator NlpD
VAQAAYEGGSGRIVKVRHSSGYLSCYLHLSRFATGIKPGRQVRQGEVIGYVGSSGLATGPHLDYRVQLNGRWINPMSISNSPAEPLAKADLAGFQAWSAGLRAALDAGQVPEFVNPPVAGATVLAQAGSPVVGAGASPAVALADVTARR